MFVRRDVPFNDSFEHSISILFISEIARSTKVSDCNISITSNTIFAQASELIEAPTVG